MSRGRPKDMTGLRFGRLLVVSRAESDSFGTARWHCVCDCGRKTMSRGVHLRGGFSQSCGCIANEISAARETKHGMHSTPTYHVWAAMVQRCTNPNNCNWPRYGGRGIYVCDRWRQFENFLADMGVRPADDLSIERIDNDKGYSPDNCKWATVLEQAANTSRRRLVTINGRTQHMAAWAREFGVAERTFYSHVAKGYLSRYETR